MVVALQAHVVGRVEVEEQKLLAEGEGGQGGEPPLRETELGGEVCEKGESGVQEHEEGDRGVLEVVEVGGRDGPVFGPRLVRFRADEKLRGDGEKRAEDDEVKLEVAKAAVAEREPGARFEMVRGVDVRGDRVVEVPQAQEQEACSWQNMADESPHAPKN